MQRDGVGVGVDVPAGRDVPGVPADQGVVAVMPAGVPVVRRGPPTLHLAEGVGRTACGLDIDPAAGVGAVNGLDLVSCVACKPKPVGDEQ